MNYLLLLLCIVVETVGGPVTLSPVIDDLIE
jgi:hypothetical protein